MEREDGGGAEGGAHGDARVWARARTAVESTEARTRDANGLITSETAPGKTVSRVYDEWGNEISRTTDTGSTTVEGFGFNVFNQVTAYTNSTTGENWQFDYWPQGELQARTNLNTGVKELTVPRFGDTVADYTQVGAGPITHQNTYVQSTSGKSKAARVASGGAATHYLNEEGGSVGGSFTSASTEPQHVVRNAHGKAVVGTTGEKYGYKQMESGYGTYQINADGSLYDDEHGFVDSSAELAERVAQDRRGLKAALATARLSEKRHLDKLARETANLALTPWGRDEWAGYVSKGLVLEDRADEFMKATNQDLVVATSLNVGLALESAVDMPANIVTAPVRYPYHFYHAATAAINGDVAATEYHSAQLMGASLDLLAWAGPASKAATWADDLVTARAATAQVDQIVAASKAAGRGASKTMRASTRGLSRGADGAAAAKYTVTEMRDIVGRASKIKGGATPAGRRALIEAHKVCFVAGTQVLTPDGSKNIEDIRAGDLVLSRSDETGEQGYRQVLQTFVTHPTRLYHLRYRAREAETSGGAEKKEEGASDDDDGPSAELVGTGEHPFWRVDDRRWVPLKELRVGDRLSLADRREAIVERIVIENAPAGERFTTYNFEVEEWHTYFVGTRPGSAWVHNECRASPRTGRLQELRASRGGTGPKRWQNVLQQGETVEAGFSRLQSVGTPGSNPMIRELSGTAADAKRIFDELAMGSSVTTATPSITVVKTPGGSYLTFRPAGKVPNPITGVPPPTIDINVTGRSHLKWKLLP